MSPLMLEFPNVILTDDALLGILITTCLCINIWKWS